MKSKNRTEFLHNFILLYVKNKQFYLIFPLTSHRLRAILNGKSGDHRSFPEEEKNGRTVQKKQKQEGKRQ